LVRDSVWFGARLGMPSKMFRSLIALVYVLAGVVVAAHHHYLRHLNALHPIASAVLAIVLWPLVLLGVNLHLH
jgi:hypothetical protein